MTQEDPLYPLIFNVVIDAALKQWVTILEATEEEVDQGAVGIEVFVWDLQQLVAYFYANNGLLALMQETRLQRAFETLTDLFDPVGLRTDVAKMVKIY